MLFRDDQLKPAVGAQRTQEPNIVARIAASEDLERTCAEKGLA